MYNIEKVTESQPGLAVCSFLDKYGWEKLNDWLKVH